MEEEKQKANPLLTFTFPTQTRCGIIMVRECANGSKKEYMKKEDAELTTVCMDAKIIPGVIETRENWDVVIIDLLDVFLHADLKQDDQMHMIMKGRLAELMVITKPKI